MAAGFLHYMEEVGVMFHCRVIIYPQVIMDTQEAWVSFQYMVNFYLEISGEIFKSKDIHLK